MIQRAEAGRRCGGAADLRISRRCLCQSRSMTFFSMTVRGRGAKRMRPGCGPAVASRSERSNGRLACFGRLPRPRSCVPGRARSSTSVASRTCCSRRAVRPPLTAIHCAPPDAGWLETLVQEPAAGISPGTMSLAFASADMTRLVAIVDKRLRGASSSRAAVEAVLELPNGPNLSGRRALPPPPR